jgi:hypothetical protein
MEASDKLHAAAAFFPGKKPGSCFKEGWVDPRAGLGVLEMKYLLLVPGFEPLSVLFDIILTSHTKHLQ